MACLKIIKQAVPKGACNGARLGADPSCAPLVASRLYNTMKPQSFWWFSFASPSLGRAGGKQHHGDAREGIRGAGGARTSGLRTSALSVQQIGEAFRLHSLQTNLLKPPENDPCLFPTPSLQHAEDKSLHGTAQTLPWAPWLLSSDKDFPETINREQNGAAHYNHIKECVL